MITFANGPAERYCDGLSRRSFLKIGGLSLGGLALPDYLRLCAEGAVEPGRKGKSVIMISLGGGPSHLDMYDMKPEAPPGIRGEFGAIRTNVPGMRLCELMPKQAKLASTTSWGSIPRRPSPT
jgi:hypothetical protein